MDSDGDGKLLAGGQSLVPLLSMRLSNPLVLVDLGRVAELAYVRLDGDVVEIGSMARHHDVETHPLCRGSSAPRPTVSRAASRPVP